MKGQATAFIILGIVILALVVTVVTFRQEIFSTLLGADIERTLTVPPQAERVKLYVDACIEETAKRGIDLLSAQGGYINLPQKPQATPLNPFGAALDVVGKNAGQVAFWATEEENTIPKNQMPTQKNIEQELAAYIDENIAFCLNDFKPLRDLGYSISTQPAQTTIALQEETITIQTNYPITVTQNEFTFDFQQFKKTIKSKFGKVYRFAAKIMEHENNNYVLEERALDMMAIYDSIPFSGIDVECTPRTWLKSKVQQELKKIFAANIPSLHIQGTFYREEKTQHKSFIIDVDSKQPRTAVTMRYSERWPLLMDVVGENDEILRGKPFTAEHEASRFLLPLFCLNEYHFVYNIKFPVLITVQEDDNYIQFATLVAIDHNQPRENKFAPLATTTPELCNNPGKELTVVAAAYRPDNSLEELANAQISYKCLEQVCDRGTTRATRTGTALTTVFPQCSDGVMIAEKQGYHRGETSVSTNTVLGEVVVYLEPIKEIPFQVKVLDNNQERSPYQTEQIMFTFENSEQRYTTSMLYPGQQTVKLIPGEYIVTSQIVVEHKGGFSFPEKEIEICNDVPEKGVLGIVGITTRKCVKQKLDAAEFEQIIGGGATTTWSVSRQALANAEQLILYTIRGPTPRSVEEMGKVYEAIRKSSAEVKKPVLL